MTVSVITPTYNRAYILPQCYASLCAQTNHNLEWIVVDDGSTDSTEALIQSYMAERKIKIRYFRQANGGKHRAHNTAVLHACGDLAVCLDSDDMLAPDAIEIACRIWEQKSTSKTIGILALRGEPQSHKPICSSIPNGLEYATMSVLRDKHDFEGDTALFFRTEILKENLFTEFTGEKFLPENNLYCALDLIGKMILLNKVLYYCEYQQDGLTAKYHRLLFENPKGTSDTYYKMSLTAPSIFKSLKYAIIAQAYNALLPKSQRQMFVKNRLLMAFARILAPIFSNKYLRKFKE